MGRLEVHKLLSIGYAFRADGRYFVLAERHRSKDTLGLYDASESYKLVRVGPFISGSDDDLDTDDIYVAFPFANFIFSIVCFVSYRKSPCCLGRTIGST